VLCTGPVVTGLQWQRQGVYLPFRGGNLQRQHAMEVSLLESEGLPEGCLLSIRSGSTRRQAVADPNKFKLVFPKGFKADDPVKVDALASLCSTNLVVEEGVERYDLQFTVPGGGACKVALLVREVVQAATEAQAAEVTGKLGTSEKGEGSASQRHRLAVSARRYLDDHQSTPLIFLPVLLTVF
ncbi:unnamed protein product, partial [Polarella glacialis]